MNLIEGNQIGGVSPIDLHPLPHVQTTALDDVAKIVDRARAAQPAWEAMGFEKRAELMKKACRLLLERREQTGKLIHDEAGKLPAHAQMHEAIGPLEYVS